MNMKHWLGIAGVPLAMLLALAAGATIARADTPPSYPELLPARLRVERNAAAIIAACAAARAGDHSCDAYRFCDSPLDLKQPLLTARQITGPICPPKTERVTPVASTLGITGSTWQSDLALGLAVFLVERAKAEALASFADQLSKGLCTKDASLLPATCGLLNGVDPYRSAIAWSVLKVAFETDLGALPARLIMRQLGVDRAQPLIALIEVLALIERGADPVQVLTGLRNKYEAINTEPLCTTNPYACSLRLLGTTAEILAPRTDAHGIVEIPADDRRRYFDIAVRLLYEEGHPIGIPESVLTDVAACERTLEAAWHLFEAVRGEAANAAAGPSAGTATSYALSVATALRSLPVVALVPKLSDQVDLRQISDILDHLARSVEHVRVREFVEAFVELQAALAAAHIEPPAWFLKYGGFVAEVASAQSKDDVKQALEAAAAPVGAWRNKRGARHSALTVNGYVGIQGGVEWLGGNGAPSDRALHGGLFAPVGLEADWGFGRTWSAGLLFSALDLGALIDVRESTAQMTSSGQDKVETTSNLGLRQVFSPGLYGVVGLGLGDGGLPLSFGIGISLAPELRSASIDSGPSRQLDALRLNAFLAIDITIFGF